MNDKINSESYQILHLDDKKSTLSEFKRYIEKYSGGLINVIEFRGALSAIDYLSSHPTPVCLVDYSLGQTVTPELDWNGLDFVRVAKLNSPNTNFIILSQARTDQLMLESARAGCFGFIVKRDINLNPSVTDEIESRRFIQYLNFARYYSEEFLRLRSDARLNFSQSIAHSLKSTLGGYRALTDQALQIVEKNQIDYSIPKIGVLLNELVYRVDDTLDAINSVLEIYNPKAMNVESNNICDVVRHAVDMRFKKLSTEFDLLKSSFVYNFGEQFIMATFSPNLLMIAVENLIDNAIKATDQLSDRDREVQVTVNVTIIANIEFLEISVIDNGVGLSPEDIENAKKPLYSGSNLQTRLASFGIGCAEAEKIAMLHRNGKLMGSLSINARDGVSGCCATIRIPRHHRPREEMLTPEEDRLDHRLK